MSKRMIRRHHPSVRCEAWDEYGCPGGPSGDAYAEPVSEQCNLPATHVVKFIDKWWDGDKAKACAFHAKRDQRAGIANVYRFRSL